MSSKVVWQDVSSRPLRVLNRCVFRVAPLVVGLLLQTTSGGCDLASTLASLQADVVKGLGTGLGNLTQAGILQLFI